MKATFEGCRQGNIASNRKENHFKRSYTGLAIYKGKIEKIVDMRIYSTRARAYVCLWVTLKKREVTSGGGRASGYGYHRASQAAQEAITDSGFTLSEDIAGRGDNIVKVAIKAIMVSLGYQGIKVIENYG